MKKTIFLCLVVLGTMFQSAEGQSITAAQILQNRIFGHDEAHLSSVMIVN